MDTGSLRKQGAVLLAQSGGCAVWQFCNEAGEGTMTTYEVFPGVMLGFNDFHMEYFESRYVADRRLLAIDHCREGRWSTPRGMTAWPTRRRGKADGASAIPSPRLWEETKNRRRPFPWT